MRPENPHLAKTFCILGFGDGQRSLACCSPWGCKDTTEQLNLTELAFLVQLKSLRHTVLGGTLTKVPTSRPDIVHYWKFYPISKTMFSNILSINKTIPFVCQFWLSTWFHHSFLDLRTSTPMSSLGTIAYLPNQTLAKEIGRTIDNYAGIIGINWNHPGKVLHHIDLESQVRELFNHTSYWRQIITYLWILHPSTILWWETPLTSWQISSSHYLALKLSLSHPSDAILSQCLGMSLSP